MTPFIIEASREDKFICAITRRIQAHGQNVSTSRVRKIFKTSSLKIIQTLTMEFPEEVEISSLLLPEERPKIIWRSGRVGIEYKFFSIIL